MLDAEELLATWLPEQPAWEMLNVLAEKVVFTFCGSEGLEESLRRAKRGGLHRKGVVLCVDEALEALLGCGASPNIVITDFEANPELVVRLNRGGCCTLICATSRNAEKLKANLPRLKKEVCLGTSEAPSYENLLELPGASKCEKAVRLAEDYDAKLIVLGSLPKGLARAAVEELAKTSVVPILSLVEGLRNVPLVSAKSVWEML